jgi:hypothetical protein
MTKVLSEFIRKNPFIFLNSIENQSSSPASLHLNVRKYQEVISDYFNCVWGRNLGWESVLGALSKIESFRILGKPIE